MVFQLQIVALLHEGPAQKGEDEHADEAADDALRAEGSEELEDFLARRIARPNAEGAVSAGENDDVAQADFRVAVLIHIHLSFTAPPAVPLRCALSGALIP